MIKLDLVVIDPQNDFCDPNGALSVPGADEDMNRLAKMIDRIGSKLNDIHCTLDTHHFVDIAHPIFWKNNKGENPAPFTIISSADVENGIWTTTQPGLFKYSLDYVKQLESNGRYPLCIWPPHCLIGTWGHNVFESVATAFKNWESQFAMVDYVTKGSNYKTEHYSGLCADVPDPNDPSTQLNTDFINTLESVDQIVIAGEASSHCVANTVRDVVNNFGDESYAKKITLLTDAMSSVPTFEQFETDFYDEMKDKGVHFSTTEEFLV